MPDCLIAAGIANHMERVLPRDGRRRLCRPVQGLRLADRGRRLHGRLPQERRAAASTSPTSGCAPWAPTASRSRRPASRTARSSAPSGSTPTASSATKDGKATFMETQWRGLQAPGKEEQKDKFPFLINNGRANHVWQSAYLDQENEFVMDRWPYPFIEMNPEDMAELGVEGGRSGRGLQRRRLDPGDGLSDADGASGRRPSCCSPIRPACRATSSTPA